MTYKIMNLVAGITAIFCKVCKRMNTFNTKIDEHRPDDQLSTELFERTKNNFNGDNGDSKSSELGIQPPTYFAINGGKKLAFYSQKIDITGNTNEEDIL